MCRGGLFVFRPPEMPASELAILPLSGSYLCPGQDNYGIRYPVPCPLIMYHLFLSYGNTMGAKKKKQYQDDAIIKGF